MSVLRRILALLFGISLIAALTDCGRRGTPSGGPKDETPPVLLKAEPDTATLNFDASRIRLYFDEFIKLQDVENQLIISPPMKYPPEISPMGGASKYVEIRITDTLLENTTYTLNFGQSVVDNNEGNPYNLLSYVFSTGDFLDSLSLTGVVADAYKRAPESFISVMLYALDTAYTDSTVYKEPPYYLTNTLDSAVIFQLNNLKPGPYRLIAIKDDAKNNIFDPGADQIGFVPDTVHIPTDTTYLLRLFKEIPEYRASRPTFAASNRILFGYTGGKAPEIELLTPIPDSVRTLLRRIPDKDSINFWFTPMEVDSLTFVLHPPTEGKKIDTFNIKPLNIEEDSLQLTWNKRGDLIPGDSVLLSSNIPLVSLDTAFIRLVDQDTLPVDVNYRLDTLRNRLLLDFEKVPNQAFILEALPGAVTDFFGDTNDTLSNRWSVGSPTEFGTLRMTLEGKVEYPVILELENARKETIRSRVLTQPEEVTFSWLKPDTYRVKVIFDANKNGRWDTGNFLRKEQPERVVHFPSPIEMRANWDNRETFTIRE